MRVHRMRSADEPFDPRRAALAHAAMAQGEAARDVPMSVLGELANALACGLVYIGDQVARLVDVTLPADVHASTACATRSAKELTTREAQRAARELVAQFVQDASGWTLDGQYVTEDVVAPLMSLAHWLDQFGGR